MENKSFRDLYIESRDKTSYCLQYIKEKLRTQSISAFVGAGFSKNAISSYPDWAELFIPAYRKIHPTQKINDNEIYKKIKLLGESKFAQEYVKFQSGTRSDLDIYIEEQLIPFEQKEADFSIHNAFLALNWCDVFTTNWDHLLERSDESKNFHIVTNSADLTHDNKRRIIKLHGSLRTKQEHDECTNYTFDNNNDYLYVVTPNDFKNYKNQHKSFSEFMITKILETPLCFFGFSGKDPNFLYWKKILRSRNGQKAVFNPIFLFTINDDISTEEKQQFFNNDIFLVSLKELNNKLNDNYIEGEINIDNTPVDYQKSLIQLFDELKEDIKDIQTLNFDTLYGIVHDSNISITSENKRKYINILLFSYENLNYSANFIIPIQNLFNKNEYDKESFLFLYKWCLGNYYSLANIYEDNKISKIIDNFNKNNFIDTDAYVFTELILKYYREQNDERKLNAYYEKLLKYPQCNNIVIYSKALKFIDNLEYESLKGLLNNWHPEKAEHPESLFIIRKISLLHMFENIRFYEDMKEEISALFKIALDNCKEEQLKLFILLFQRQYNNVFFIQADDSNEKLIKQLREKELSEPYKYLEKFETKYSPNNDTKSNESKRYTITWKLSGNDSNQDFLNSIRVLNFFEYTGLSMELFYSPKKIKSLITAMKTSDYYLSKMFVHCISYFGNDSDEDFVKLSVDKIVRYLNSETIINIYNAIYKILVYKVNHQRNARSYLFICNELSKYFNDNSSKLSKLIYSEIKESNDSNYQIANLIRRGRVWGAKRVFEDYLLKVKDDEEYKFVLEWIINEYIKDERDLVKQQHYTSSEFFDYYFDLLVKNPKTESIREVINQSDVIKLFEEDFSYEKQLCLYGYEFLPEDLKQKTKEFFEVNFTVYTDPYFITTFKSDTLKNKIISIVQEDNPLSFNSRKYQITKYIRVLNQIKMLNLDDKRIISNIIKTRFEKVLKNKDYFSHGFTSLKDTIADLFYCLENITTEEERNSCSEIQDVYNAVKTEFQNQIHDFYSFEWLYTGDYQKFRIAFSNAVSYFSYLHQAKEYLYIFNLVLSKLIVQDNSNFEAVLELFANIYSNKYEKSVLINKETHTLLLQLMKKYQIEISIEYDYLFIRKQMKLLAEALSKNDVKDEVIDYWISV